MNLYQAVQVNEIVSLLSLTGIPQGNGPGSQHQALTRVAFKECIAQLQSGVGVATDRQQVRQIRRCPGIVRILLASAAQGADSRRCVTLRVMRLSEVCPGHVIFRMFSGGQL